jgi:hypothetical protein
VTTAYEAAYHIGQVRLRGGLPSTDARFTDAKLLKLLTDELQGHIAPLIHNAKADHGVVQYTVAATVGTPGSVLPSTAFANTLRDVYWIDASGNITPLDPRSAADPLMYELGRNNGTPRYYFMRGSSVVIVPPPAAAGTLAMPHYSRPKTLSTVFAGIASAADLGNGIVSLTLSADAPAGLVNQDSVHLVRASPGFESIIDNVGATWATATSLTISAGTSASASDIAAGDYLALPGTSPVPQCPVELFPLLHARAALVAVPSTGDMSQAAAALAAQVADLEAKAVSFLRPRVESAQPPPGRGGMGSNPLLDTLNGGWGGF